MRTVTNSNVKEHASIATATVLELAFIMLLLTVEKKRIINWDHGCNLAPNQISSIATSYQNSQKWRLDFIENVIYYLRNVWMNVIWKIPFHHKQQCERTWRNDKTFVHYAPFDCEKRLFKPCCVSTGLDNDARKRL